MKHLVLKSNHRMPALEPALGLTAPSLPLWFPFPLCVDFILSNNGGVSGKPSDLFPVCLLKTTLGISCKDCDRRESQARPGPAEEELQKTPLTIRQANNDLKDFLWPGI